VAGESDVPIPSLQAPLANVGRKGSKATTSQKKETSGHDDVSVSYTTISTRRYEANADITRADHVLNRRQKHALRIIQLRT
jgi:hypothetical protein